MDIGEPPPARILVVDGRPSGRCALAEDLARYGYAVDLLDSARQAFALAQTGRWDAVVINPGLPDLTGVELYTRLPRAGWRDCLPVIFVRGCSVQKLLQALRLLPRASLPALPPGVLQFLDTLEQCLEHSQAAG